MNLAELKKIAELALAGGINDEIAIQRYEVFEEYVSPALILRMIDNYEKAVGVLKKIANEDFRGNRPQSAVDAYKTLKDLGEVE